MKGNKTFQSELTEKKKPIVLFFSGPTGVGKTESAKLLAKNLMFSEDAMIRFNMSEYMEQASLSKLIGTSPGYIGFEQNGRLTEAVNKNPNTIILLDEFEKAHPRISDIFLSIFDEGEIADSKNNVIDFRNTIIILTSNIGTQKKKQSRFSK
ncbi:ATP-dependent Clp protease ATP-binding subunit [Bacillus megaterium]|nr:ATP-dependent Clp protease ATP-binding subunit [Priestia megaterium]